MNEKNKINSNDSSTTLINWLSYIDNDSLQLPRIQRNSVWNDEKNAALLDSIIVGYPFGIITMSSINKDNIEDYYIIDGLQRTIAIKKISTSYWELFSSNYEYFNNVISLVDKLSNSRVKDYIANLRKLNSLEVLRNTIQFVFKHREMLSVNESDIEFTELDLEIIVSNILKNPLNDKFIFEASKTRNLLFLINEIVKNRISSSKIPFQVYNIQTDDYDEHELLINEAFNRLNSQGVSLNAFELLTSTWNKHKIIIKNPQSILLTQLKKIFTSTKDKRSILKMFSITDSITPSELLIGCISKAIEEMDKQNSNNLFKRYFTVQDDHALLINVNNFMPFFMNVFFGQINEGESTSKADKLGIVVSNFFNNADIATQDKKITGFINALIMTFEIVNDSVYDVISFKGIREQESIKKTSKVKKTQKAKKLKPRYEEKLGDSTFVMTLLSTLWKNHIDVHKYFQINITKNKHDWYLQRSPLLYVRSKIKGLFSSSTIARSRKLTNENDFDNYISDPNWETNKFQLIDKLDKQYRRQIGKDSNQQSLDEIDITALVVNTKKREFTRLSISVSLMVHNLLLPNPVQNYGSNLVMDHFIPWNKAREQFGTNLWFNLSFIENSKNIAKLDHIELGTFENDPILLNFLSKIYSRKIKGKNIDDWLPESISKHISKELVSELINIEETIEGRHNVFKEMLVENEEVEYSWKYNKKPTSSGISCDYKIVSKVYKLRYLIYIITLITNA